METKKPAQRKEPRIGHRLVARFGLERPQYRGIVKNISRHGACIACRDLIAPLTRLEIRIETPEMPVVTMGEVRWSRRFAANMSFVNDCEMGVQFTELDSRLAAYVDELAGAFVERRSEPRIAKVFQVAWSNQAAMTGDISANGAYVVTANSPTVKSMVELHLTVPGLKDLVIAEAQVVRVIDEEAAYDRHVEPGFAARFTRFISENRAAFLEAIERPTAAS